MTPLRRQALGTGALAGAACVACCAPPILAALGLTLGLAVLAGVMAGLAVAVAVAVIGVAAVSARRARPTRCEPVAPVAVAAPRRR